MRNLRPYAAVREWLLSQCKAVTETESVPLTEAVGRRLAAAIAAPHDVPRTRIATIDGIAVVAAENLGASPYNPMADGVLTEVRTGDPLPTRADAVAPWEIVLHQGGERYLTAEIDIGNGVCSSGQLLACGSTPVEPAKRLTARDIALLLELGQRDVSVSRRPRVGITHFESALAGEPIEVLLRWMVRRSHGEVSHFDGSPPVSDQATDQVLLYAAANTDILLVIAGPGEGRCAEAAAVIDQAGHLDAFGIAMRPGQLSGVGVIDDTPVLLVPGEPVAAQAVADLLGATALRMLNGELHDAPRGRFSGPLTHKVSSALGVVDYIRVQADNGQLRSRRIRTELDLAALAATDGYVLVEADSEGYQAGTVVTAYLDDF